MNLTYERAGGFRSANYGQETRGGEQNYYTEKYQYNQVYKPNSYYNKEKE